MFTYRYSWIHIERDYMYFYGYIDHGNWLNASDSLILIDELIGSQYTILGWNVIFY